MGYILTVQLSYCIPFVRIVDLLELAEDICVLRRDAAGLQHSNTEGEDASNLQLTCHTITTTQLSLCNVTQLEVWRKPQGRVRTIVVWYVIYWKWPAIVLFIICIWILSSRLVSAHSGAWWSFVQIPSQSRKNCTSLIFITIHLKCIQQDHLPSVSPPPNFPLGGEVEIYEWRGEGLAAVPMSLILLSSSEGVMTSELWPWPSTKRSSSRDKPERVMTVEGKSFWLDKKEVDAKARVRKTLAYSW